MDSELECQAQDISQNEVVADNNLEDTSKATATTPNTTSTPAKELDESSILKKRSGCGVCLKNDAKYKCSRCYLPYCSVVCSKLHQDNHPPDQERETSSSNTQADLVEHTTKSTSNTSNPFRDLDDSDRLKLLFRKHPSLPAQLKIIHNAMLPPPKTETETAGIPASLLKGRPEMKSAWNHDIAIQKGKEALRKARRADSDEGDAIREYSELILHILDTSNAEIRALGILQQQVAEQDTKLIQSLLAEERR